MKMKEAGKGALKFVAAGGGLAVSAFGLKQLDSLIPSSVPSLVKKLGPGVATMLISYMLSTKVDNDKLKALVLGIGAGGALDAIRKVLGDKIPFIANNTPALSGMPQYRSVNTGGVGWDYYRDNSLQGLGGPYALSGDTSMSMQGIAMQGLGQGGAMSAANSYALNGPYALT